MLISTGEDVGRLLVLQWRRVSYRQRLRQRVDHVFERVGASASGAASCRCHPQETDGPRRILKPPEPGSPQERAEGVPVHCYGRGYVSYSSPVINLDSPCPVVGESGLGKSTLVNTLFNTKLYPQKTPVAPHEERPQTVAIESISAGEFIPHCFHQHVLTSFRHRGEWRAAAPHRSGHTWIRRLCEQRREVPSHSRTYQTFLLTPGFPAGNRLSTTSNLASTHTWIRRTA